MTEPKQDVSSFQAVAYDKIREDIIFCRLAPGQKLSARILEETLGLGRTPVREALVRLGQEGMVFTVPQSGTYVSKIDLQSAENARYVRENLERSVAVECCALIMIWNRSTPGMMTSSAEATMIAVMRPR